MAISADTASIRTATEDVRACGAKPRTSPSSPGFFSKANAAFATRYRPDSRRCRVDGERAPAAIVNSRAAGFGAWLTAFLACVACVACVTFVAFEPVSGEEFNDAPNIAAAHGAQVSVRRSLLASADWVQVGSNLDGHYHQVYSGSEVSISADGTRVAICDISGGAGGSERSVTIRDYDATYSNGVQYKWKYFGSIGGSPSSTSLSADGTRVAVGIPSSKRTRVYEYDATSSDFVQVGADIDDGTAGSEAGQSVSISSDGKRVAIGAPASANGHVSVYEESGGTWTQVGVDIDGEAAGDKFGTSVSISSDGTVVAIGAPGNDDNGADDSGHVRVYVYSVNNQAWFKFGGDIDGEAAGDKFGTSVSISVVGNTYRVAIGAPGNGGNGANSGHARVYAYNNGNSAWEKLGGDIDGDAADDLAGTSVSISGDGTHVAVGAPRWTAYQNYWGAGSPGYTRVYKYDAAKVDAPAKWAQVGGDVNGLCKTGSGTSTRVVDHADCPAGTTSSRDNAGVAVSLSSDGSQLAIGATNALGSEWKDWQTGSVRIYSTNNCDATAVPTNGAVGDCLYSLAPGETCTPACDSGYTLSGDRSCAASAVYTDGVCNANPCDASTAPVGGGVGDCTSSLASGSTCQPVCDFGSVSGPSSCSLGVLTAATCGCDASAAPANGAAGDCPSSLAPGSTCQPVCDSGYSPSGPTSCAAGVLTAATCIALKWSNSTEFVPGKGTEHPSVDVAAVAIAAVALFAFLVVNVVDAVASLRRPRRDVGRDDGEKVGAAGDSRV